MEKEEDNVVTSQASEEPQQALSLVCEELVFQHNYFWDLKLIIYFVYCLNPGLPVVLAQS